LIQIGIVELAAPTTFLLRADALWGGIKAAVEIFTERSLGFSHDALHVLVGACLQLLLATLLRTSVRSLKPWALVLVLELLNEVHDLRVETWPSPAMQWGESAKDVLLTMALPTVLLLAARYAPSLFGPARPGRPS
jgi:hypothetical protein